MRSGDKPWSLAQASLTVENGTLLAMADSVSWRGQDYELVSDDELVLILLAGRLADLREEWAAAVSDAKVAVRDAFAAGVSERAIARSLGVHRRTVRSWRVSE